MCVQMFENDFNPSLLEEYEEKHGLFGSVIRTTHNNITPVLLHMIPRLPYIKDETDVVWKQGTKKDYLASLLISQINKYDLVDVPHLLPVIGICETFHYVYFVMRDLSHTVPFNLRVCLSTTQKLLLLKQICLAMTKLHERKLPHLVLQPDTIRIDTKKI